MMYRLDDLLKKMGAPEVRERGRVEWHYFDKKTKELAGYAEIRMEAGGEFLVAEIKRLHDRFEDDHGVTHKNYTETFFLYAERAARPDHYRVTRIAFDGEDYGHPVKPIIELGLSVFHARALDISIRMIEQVFNKMDILSPAEEPIPDVRPSFAAARQAIRSHLKKPETKKQEPFGVVIPFRPREKRIAL